jgi:hypothetical protein
MHAAQRGGALSNDVAASAASAATLIVVRTESTVSHTEILIENGVLEHDAESTMCTPGSEAPPAMHAFRRQRSRTQNSSSAAQGAIAAVRPSGGSDKKLSNLQHSSRNANNNAASSKLDALLNSHGDDDNGSEGEATSEMWSEADCSVCSICMDMPVAVLVAGCHHGLCVQCAFQLTIKGRELPSCPFCRQKIVCFEPKGQSNTAAVASAGLGIGPAADVGR